MNQQQPASVTLPTPAMPSISTGYDLVDGLLNAAIGWTVYEDFQDASQRQQSIQNNVPRDNQTNAKTNDSKQSGFVNLNGFVKSNGMALVLVAAVVLGAVALSR